MSRAIIKALSAVGLLGSLAAAVPSCADNNQSLFIQQVQKISTPDCLAKPDPTSPFRPGGDLDLAFQAGYSVWALVGSQLLSRGSPTASHAETDRVIFQGADVHIEDDGGIFSGDFSVTPVNGTVASTPSSDAAWGVANVSLIPPKIGAVYYKAFTTGAKQGLDHDPVTVKATFKVYGVTLGNQTVESAPFTYPIVLTYGRSVDPTGFDLKADPTGLTCASGAATSTSTGPTIDNCAAGVDGYTTCSVCRRTSICAFCDPSADTCPKGTHCNACYSRCNL